MLGLLEPKEDDTMRTTRFTEEQIVKIVQEAAAHDAATVCRRHGIGRTTLWRWQRVYGGLEPSAVRALKRLEAENRRLREVVAELSVDNRVLKDVLAKKR